MWRRLLGFLRRKPDSERLRSPIEKDSSIAPTRLFIAPSYDPLTRCTIRWAPQITEADFTLLGRSATPEAVEGVLGAASGGVLLVFLGHGTQSAYLTAPELGGSPAEYRYLHGTLVSKEVLAAHAGPVWAYGHCCWSAEGIGRELRARDDGSDHLGFTGDVPVLLGEPYESAFRRPFVAAAVDAMRRTVVDPETRGTLLRAYQEEWRQWQSGAESRNDLSLLVTMFLEEHTALLG